MTKIDEWSVLPTELEGEVLANGQARILDSRILAALEVFDKELAKVGFHASEWSCTARMKYLEPYVKLIDGRFGAQQALDYRYDLLDTQLCALRDLLVNLATMIGPGKLVEERIAQQNINWWVKNETPMNPNGVLDLERCTFEARYWDAPGTTGTAYLYLAFENLNGGDGLWRVDLSRAQRGAQPYPHYISYDDKMDILKHLIPSVTAMINSLIGRVDTWDNVVKPVTGSKDDA